MLLAGILLAACSGGGVPMGWRGTPDGDGPTVLWELDARPLPKVPLPNDIATWPDPTSPTGLRVNVGKLAPTSIETLLRNQFDELDGWSAYGPIEVAFDAPLDTDGLIARQGREHFSQEDFQRHAVYLIDLETGIPVPLDVNSGSFSYAVHARDGYYESDPRAGESNLLFETVDEDQNGNGVLDPLEDTDFDGVLDRPNTLDGRLHGDDHETYDRMLWFYERETNSLMLRPLLPLEERRRYAVVLTDRLVGADGQPIRSPLPFVHHVGQTDALSVLPELMAARPHIYGADLAQYSWDHIAFAWVFTTQSVTTDLRVLREGLYGRGPFAYLAEDFPANLFPSPLYGGTRTTNCDPVDNVYIVTPQQVEVGLRRFASGLADSYGISEAQIEALFATFDSVAHFAYVFFESPYLFGDPADERPEDKWDVDWQTGAGRVERDLVSAIITIPKETETNQQPFPVTTYANGTGNPNIESLAWSGLMARQGIATVSLTSQGHGVPVSDDLRSILESVFGAECLAPLGQALTHDRAYDLNGDGQRDSAGLIYTPYMFHSRDTLRQTALDYLQAIRIIRGFAGHPDHPEGLPWAPGEVPSTRGGQDPLRFDGDVDGDGEVELAGDFDANGVPDIGGWDRPYYQWGVSLGGVLSEIIAGVEPAITVAAPVSAGGGLSEIGVRSNLGIVRDPVWLSSMGPLVTASPSTGVGETTGCVEGELSVRFEVADLNLWDPVEFACMPDTSLLEGDAVILRNFANGESRCAGVLSGGRFRTFVPSSAGDPLQLEIYRQGAAQLDAGDCVFTGDEAPALVDVIAAFRSVQGEPAPGQCPRCGVYQGHAWERGDLLRAPAAGFGVHRQGPDMRRVWGTSQMGVDGADPIHYARSIFLDPPTAADVRPRTRSVLVLNSAGDYAVPNSTGNAYARAAGILPFLPYDAPDEYKDYRAPAWFESTYGAPSPNDVLIDHHVLEGVAWLNRHPVPGAPGLLFDVDDLSEGRQRFNSAGTRQVSPEETGFVPNRLDPPLRWVRESRPRPLAAADIWGPYGSFEGQSGVLNAMIYGAGWHVFMPVDPDKAFDEAEYLVNLVAWYFRSNGADLRYHSDPDGHHCLENSTCGEL